MAEFSKEYNTKTGMFPVDMSDFSIQEIFDELQDNHYQSIICEGYGFVGIAKVNGKCQVAVPAQSEHEGEPYNSGVEWKNFNFDTLEIE